LLKNGIVVLARKTPVRYSIMLLCSEDGNIPSEESGGSFELVFESIGNKVGRVVKDEAAGDKESETSSSSSSSSDDESEGSRKPRRRRSGNAGKTPPAGDDGSSSSR
jgi:hypothetical protein